MKRKLILFYSTLVGILCFNFMSCVDIDLSNLSKDVQIKESLVMPIGQLNLTAADLMRNFNNQGRIYIPIDTVITVSDTVKNINVALDKIDYATLDLTVTNGLPFQVSFFMKFLDVSNSDIVVPALSDTIYVANSAILAQTGLVSDVTVTSLKINLTNEQLKNKLKNAKNMIFKINFNAKNNSILRQSDIFNIKMSLSGKSVFTANIDSIN